MGPTIVQTFRIYQTPLLVVLIVVRHHQIFGTSHWPNRVTPESFSYGLQIFMVYVLKSELFPPFSILLCIKLSCDRSRALCPIDDV